MKDKTKQTSKTDKHLGVCELKYQQQLWTEGSVEQRSFELKKKKEQLLNAEREVKVNKPDIAVCNRNYHTATGNHMPGRSNTATHSTRKRIPENIC